MSKRTRPGRRVTPDPEAVRTARGQHVWSQTELARRAECTPGTISRIESGAACSPKLLATLATVLDVPHAALLRVRPAGCVCTVDDPRRPCPVHARRSADL